MSNTSTLSAKDLAIKAKEATYKMASVSTEIKNKALLAIAENIEKNKQLILEENKKDMDQAQQLLKENKISKAFVDRLKLTESKIGEVIAGIKDVSKLEDPVNKQLFAIELDENLNLYQVSCPIGLITVIFESRPDVIPQITSLIIKSSNAVILKGGSEAFYTNQVMVKVINESLKNIQEIPDNLISLVNTREDINELLKLDDLIDLIIPRGSNSLVKYIKNNTRVPVLGHADGICHIYVDESADLNKATKIIIDAKTQYPSACNAVETLLVNKKLCPDYLKTLINELKQNQVIVKGDKLTLSVVKDIEEATEEDWTTEYGDKIVSIRVVENLEEAINHINKYGSGHTDCILTENKQNAEIFMNRVDSAGVYLNASTRFADGFRYGFGAEVGISTNKTHARGPVGLEGLVIYKFKLFGEGQIVADYTGSGAKTFTHKKKK